MIEIDGLRYSSAGRLIFDGLSLQRCQGQYHGHHGAERHRQDDHAADDHRAAEAGCGARGGRTVRTCPDLNRADLLRLRRRMGMLFQNSALLTDDTVFENVAFPVREHTRLPERLIRTVVLTKLHTVGLRGAAGLMPAQLSGGMARRVALARAMVLDPDLLLVRRAVLGS